jgi:hypothetical protein
MAAALGDKGHDGLRIAHFISSGIGSRCQSGALVQICGAIAIPIDDQTGSETHQPTTALEGQFAPPWRVPSVRTGKIKNQKDNSRKQQNWVGSSGRTRTYNPRRRLSRCSGLRLVIRNQRVREGCVERRLWGLAGICRLFERILPVSCVRIRTHCRNHSLKSGGRNLALPPRVRGNTRGGHMGNAAHPCLRR